MADFDNNHDSDLDYEDEGENYLASYKRSRIIKQIVSVIAALLILTVSVFAALFINAKTNEKKPLPADDSSAVTNESSEAESSDMAVSDDESITESETESSTESEDGTSSEPDESDDVSMPILYGVTIDSIYVYGDVGLQYFASSSVAEGKFADTLNSYRNAFPSSVNMYSIIVPTYAEFYKFDDGKKIGQSQTDSIARINAKLASGIKPVDIIPKLEEHNTEYLYYRTDINWSPLAAYYAYVKFMEEIGQTPVALDVYEKGTIAEFVGSSYIRSQAKQLLEKPDYIDFYRVDKKYPSNVTQYFYDGTVYKNSQLVFKNVSGITNGYQIFGAETRYVRVKTTAGTGKKLLILRENSATAFLPYLLPHFDEIHAVDTRYFHKYSNEAITDFVKDMGITDVVFMYYSTSANTGARISELNALITKRNAEIE